MIRSWWKPLPAPHIKWNKNSARHWCKMHWWSLQSNIFPKICSYFHFIPSTYSFWACFWTAGPTSGNKETSETAAPCEIRWVPSLWMRLFNISACASRPKWSPTDLNGEKVFKGYPFPQNLTRHVLWKPINLKWKRDLNPIFRWYVSFQGVYRRLCPPSYTLENYPAGTWKSLVCNMKIIWTIRLHDFGFQPLVFLQKVTLDG